MYAYISSMTTAITQIKPPVLGQHEKYKSIRLYRQNGRAPHAACRHSERLLLRSPSGQTPRGLLSETASHATMHSWHRHSKPHTELLIDLDDLAKWLNVVALHGKPTSELRNVTCHMRSHSVTCHLTQVITPCFNPGRQTLYSICRKYE